MFFNLPSMNFNIQPIHLRKARSHGFARPRDYRFVLHQPAIAVHLSEVGALVPTLPLAFAKLQDDSYLLVAVTGFADGRNLLVDDSGRWGMHYVPNQLCVYPFSLRPLANQEASEQALAVCFDHASGLYRESPNVEIGESYFFDDEGQTQALFQEVTEQLRQHMAQQQQTQRAVTALLQAQLLAPWRIPGSDARPDSVLPRGLYCVDEAKLNSLKGDALEALHHVHALALAHAQLLSTGRVTVLQRLQTAHASRNKGPQPPVDPAIVKQMFEPGQPDTIQFNW